MGIKDEITQAIKGQELVVETMTSAIRSRRNVMRRGGFDNGIMASYRTKLADAKKSVKALKKELAAVNRNAVMLSVLDKIVLRIENLEDRIDNLRIEV